MKTERQFHESHQPGTEKQAGFGLVELMVSITIGLLIVSALLTLLINSTKNNAEMAKTHNLIENGRFAIQLLENDIVHAGFWGSHVPEFDNLAYEKVPGDVPIAIPDPCLEYETWDKAYRNALVGIPLQSYLIDSAETPLALAECAIFQNTDDKPIPGTDVLIVRHADTCIPGSSNCEAEDSSKLYFQASLCSDDVERYILDRSGFTGRKNGCSETADKRKFIAHLYYIRNYAVSKEDRIPTLVRSEFDVQDGTLVYKPAIPVIEGIQGFRVEFGIDRIGKTGAETDYSSAVTWQAETDPVLKMTPKNRGDGVPDESCFSDSPCTLNQLMNVTSARIHVLARNRDSTSGYTDTKTYSLGNATLGPFNDSFKRHVFSTTVRLVNVSGRRETP